MDRFPILKRYEDELGYRLDDDAVEKLTQFRDLLLDWNKRFNLTRVTDPAEIETRLLLDALAMLPSVHQPDVRLRKRDASLRLVDVGAGAGFPGLPLKIVDDDIVLVLIEATAKKVGFMREAIRELGLTHVEAIHGRSEDLAHDNRFRSSFDVVTARAVARLPALLEICMPFCRPGGRGLFPKGRDVEAEVANALHASKELHCRILGVETPQLPELGGTGYVVVEQISAPPSRYPRRAGIPAKDPL